MREYDQIMAEANDAFDRGSYRKAFQIALVAIDSLPEDPWGYCLAGAAQFAMQRFQEALPHLRKAVSISPDYADAHYYLGMALFYICDFSSARHHLERVLESDPEWADGHYWMAMCLERSGEFERADAGFAKAAELDPDRCRLPFRLPRKEFDKVVQAAIQSLPPDFRNCLDNLQIIVDDLPADDLFTGDRPLNPELFGLYSGIALVNRSLYHLPHPAPDRIYIFRRNLERYCGNREQLEEEIRVTLLHEVGHALGLDEDALRQLGY